MASDPPGEGEGQVGGEGLRPVTLELAAELCRSTIISRARRWH
jgi:hypothetical protein